MGGRKRHPVERLRLRLEGRDRPGHRRGGAGGAVEARRVGAIGTRAERGEVAIAGRDDARSVSLHIDPSPVVGARRPLPVADPRDLQAGTPSADHKRARARGDAGIGQPWGGGQGADVKVSVSGWLHNDDARVHRAPDRRTDGRVVLDGSELRQRAGIQIHLELNQQHIPGHELLGGLRDGPRRVVGRRRPRGRGEERGHRREGGARRETGDSLSVVPATENAEHRRPVIARRVLVVRGVEADRRHRGRKTLGGQLHMGGGPFVLDGGDPDPRPGERVVEPEARPVVLRGAQIGNHRGGRRNQRPPTCRAGAAGRRGRGGLDDRLRRGPDDPRGRPAREGEGGNEHGEGSGEAHASRMPELSPEGTAPNGMN